MRLDSLLFAAVLFACFNTSSTRSVSTSVEPITSDEKDVPDGVETTKEERAFNLPGLDKVIEGTNSMASKFVEKMLYWVLRASGKNAVEAYRFLQLDKDNSIRLRNVRYNAWVRYLAKASDTLVLKMLKDLTKANAQEDILAELKTALMPLWKAKKSGKEVFTLLELDQTTDRMLYIKLLTIWVECLKNDSRANLRMKQMITDYGDVKIREILDGLSEIEGTEKGVKRIQNYMVESWTEDEKSAEDVFITLQLDKGGSQSNFDMWAKYVVRTSDTLQITESAITKLSELHDEVGLLKMFDAFAKAKASEDVLITLKSTLMASWKDQGMSMVAVFKLLKLDQKNDYVLRNEVLREARFGVWVQYAAKKPNELSSTTIEMVSKHYGDVGLLKIFEAFAKAEASKEVLLPLKSALMAFWKDKKRWAKDI